MGHLTNKQMQDRLGVSPSTMKGLQFVCLEGELYHPTQDGWEPYEDDEPVEPHVDNEGHEIRD